MADKREKEKVNGKDIEIIDNDIEKGGASEDYFEVDGEVVDTVDFLFDDDDIKKIPARIRNKVIDEHAQRASDVNQGDLSKLSIEGVSADVLENLKGGRPCYNVFSMEEPRPKKLFIKPIYRRQLGESKTDYRHLLTFAALPFDKRTVANTWRKWMRQNKEEGDYSDQVSGYWYRMSKHWRWDERAYAMDIGRLRATEQIWMERDLERREADWSAATQLRNKAVRALSELDTDDITPRTIATYVELASNMQSRVIPHLNLDTTQVSDILSSLSNDRRGKVLRILMAEIQG